MIIEWLNKNKLECRIDQIKVYQISKQRIIKEIKSAIQYLTNILNELEKNA
jgi:heme oxygenase